VAVKIKLKRMGKIRAPYYRIVIADSRTKRDGRAIEEIGKYHPTEEPSLIQVDSERVQYWLSVGAQPTDAVAALLRVTGDWQRFKGLPGAEGTLRVAEPRPDKKATFDQAAREAMAEPKEGATAPRARSGRPASRPAKSASSADQAADKAAETASDAVRADAGVTPAATNAAATDAAAADADLTESDGT
jgi:small subunit ribosomal protein S16